MAYRGGRGGARGGARGSLKGATWEHDPTIKLESAPSELFPKHPSLSCQAPLTKNEKRQVRNLKAALEAVYSGPLYTHPTKRDTDRPAKTFSQDQLNKQYGSRGKADIDPFNSVETYSQKYNPPKRTIPNLKPVILDKKLFPKELWITLDGEEGREVRQHLDSAMRKKAEVDTMADPALNTSKDLNKLLLETIKRVAGEEDNDGEAEEAEKETGPDEEEDYDYEEDEGDMGGDYDAEKYFDDGENDEEDGEAGGDDY